MKNCFQIYSSRGSEEGSVRVIWLSYSPKPPEKLETLASRGAANSRMKDYHVLLLLYRENHLIDKIGV